MELMIAWWPMASFIVSLMLVVLTGMLALRGHYKRALALGVIWAILVIFSPIKIDGTESRKARQLETVQATAYHSQHTVEAIPAVTVHKLTFAERMAQEYARSAAANQRITDEISK
jgi:hypothetical protein